jgi:CO/xanthine dehydrogenase Mo-binding subunit
VSADGRFHSLKTDVLDDYGAYLSLGVATHGNALAQVTGAYKIPSTSYRLRAVLTNKVQQGAYRGFGAEVASWVIERLVDKAARELGIDPVEIRRRNFIQPDEFPHHIATGNMYDSGNYEATLSQALELFGYEDWLTEQQRMRAEGRHVGVGVVTTVERSVYSSTEFWFWFDDPPIQITSSPEGVTIEVDALGHLVVTLYAAPFWGNSSDTMAAMLVAEEFGVDPSAVTVKHHHGSQGGLPAAGPGGSRLTVMLAGAIRGAATKIKDKARKIAAHLMEASADDLEWNDGEFTVRGDPDQRRSLAEVAMAAHLFAQTLPEGTETGLVENYVYEHPYTTMPADDRSDLGVFYPCMGNACHVTAVEVDTDTGAVRILKYVAVHDSGTIVNPRALEGQVIGGTVQGLATALSEELAFDDLGQPLTTTLWDFGMPTAADVPEMIVGHEQTPSPLTEHGIKGGGEAGRLVAPAAISAAIDDALADLGVRITELPATPERIHRQLSRASASAT